ncbi:endonuclease, partial [Endozoicomonas sp.]|nr:endonuclease [Endozoicomonas sp.]
SYLIHLTLADHTTSGRTPFIGELCTLYRWHHDDPVDYQEIPRNGLIYSWQGNRNPFIHHPE